MFTKETVNVMTDGQLIEKARLGNRAAMEAIILRYRNTVSMIASKYYMNGFEKDDIIQEGMIGLYTAVQNYKTDKISFSSFASLCITRRIISLLRAAHRKKHCPLNTYVSLDARVSADNDTYLVDTMEATAISDPESILIGKESLLSYKEQINVILSPFELDIFSLYLEGLSYKDISVKCGKNVKAVDNAIQRIRKKLSVIVC